MPSGGSMPSGGLRQKLSTLLTLACALSVVGLSAAPASAATTPVSTGASAAWPSTSSTSRTTSPGRAG
jgi:hypothetical protein